ncbi:transglutaminase domain-containing protein [Hoeflea sp. YIM 152468]|uniref:transglutaminase domain-containing protein n=1 Tax=Hoeflea sp. YIM 152468 TaxID=3031759 RepID=UPI0023DCB69F|nr:transglutaminase domain-containing protein [Hoeflea sp. YIM 152468]MDF1610276.1 transglutaminase domain-containing protein [Hoeflea sp. YIM 152468]
MSSAEHITNEAPIGTITEVADCQQEDPVKRHACLIRMAAEGARSVGSDMTSFEFLAALETLSFVQLTISSARYALLANKLGTAFPAPVLDPKVYLNSGYGICGQHQMVFSAILDELGIKSRIVQLWYSHPDGSHDSHIAAEAKIDGKWVYFDTTAGAIFFKDINDPASQLSIAELIALGRKNVDVSINNNVAWNFSRFYTDYDLLGYLDADDLDVAVNGEGTVRPLINWDNTDGTLITAYGQNFIGDNLVEENGVGYTYRITPPEPGKYSLKGAVDVGGCAGGLEICTQDTCHVVSQGEIDFTAETGDDGAFILSVKAQDGVCYAVFRELHIKKIE